MAPDGADFERLERVGQAILALYRGCRAVSAAGFCPWALGLLKQVVRFDSAMWGHGHADPVAIHDVYLDGQSPAMMSNYARFEKDDFFAAACNRTPGRTVNLYDLIDRRDLVRLPIYRRHAALFGLEHILCTVIPEPDSGLVSFISLWRSRYEDPYDESDRLAKQLLMPHLVESRRQSVFEHLRRAHSPEPVVVGAGAVCDPKGILHECEPGFGDCLRVEWPDWRGPALPRELARAIARAPRSQMGAGAQVFEWTPVEDRRFIRVRPLHPVDSLSPREREVARLLVEGRTHKEIAASLGVSPNTARTHIYLLYRRLGVSNRAQAVGLFGAAPASARTSTAPRRASTVRPRSRP